MNTYNATLYINKPGLLLNKKTSASDIETYCFASYLNLEELEERFELEMFENVYPLAEIRIYNEKGKQVKTLPVTKQKAIDIFYSTSKIVTR